jgi:hypothetical protein
MKIVCKSVKDGKFIIELEYGIRLSINADEIVPLILELCKAAGAEPFVTVTATELYDKAFRHSINPGDTVIIIRKEGA